MTEVEQLAAFVHNASYTDLSETARTQLKHRVLDALGCAIGALQGDPIRMLKSLLNDFGESQQCTLIGGGHAAPDRAALFNSALVRYLDFNDSYLAPKETCHPSDNLGSLLSSTEYTGGSGKDLMTALALAYQVQCRLSDAAPVRDKGFDHTTQGAYAVAAGVSKALELNIQQTANAIAISGTALNALRVSRTGALSNWKGLAYPYTAFGATQATFLARQGITGPLEVFEGNKGFKETIAGPFEIDWSKEDLESVTKTILKRYNAEIHSQATLEGILELRQEQKFTGDMIGRIDIETFEVAFNIIGGGEEGDKQLVRRKEEADHSLPYLVAVAILDGQVMPEQYRPERIQSQDVQNLLRKIKVRPNENFSRRFPNEMPCRITLWLRDGRELAIEKRDYQGFVTHPLGWEGLVEKFERLSEPFAGASLRDEIIDAVSHLETIRVADLMKLLAKVGRGELL
jgi:2-methylcitrate dehydratase